MMHNGCLIQRRERHLNKWTLRPDVVKLERCSPDRFKSKQSKNNLTSTRVERHGSGRRLNLVRASGA